MASHEAGRASCCAVPTLEARRSEVGTRRQGSPLSEAGQEGACGLQLRHVCWGQGGQRCRHLLSDEVPAEALDAGAASRGCAKAETRC